MALNALQLANLTSGEDDPTTPLPQPKLTTDAATLASLKREIEGWHNRGGKMSPNDPAGGGIKMPGGTYGGEFGDTEMRAYNSAVERYHAMQAQHDAEQRLNTAGNAAESKISAPSDATSVLLRALKNMPRR